MRVNWGQRLPAIGVALKGTLASALKCGSCHTADYTMKSDEYGSTISQKKMLKLSGQLLECEYFLVYYETLNQENKQQINQ